MFAHSFKLVSLHCVARGLRTSFLYKCPTSRGSSLRQHGLRVVFVLVVLNAYVFAVDCCYRVAVKLHISGVAITTVYTLCLKKRPTFDLL